MHQFFRIQLTRAPFICQRCVAGTGAPGKVKLNAGRQRGTNFRVGASQGLESAGLSQRTPEPYIGNAPQFGDTEILSTLDQIKGILSRVAT